MIRTFKFYKDIQADWYIDLPEYPGELADLQMVIGADVMLDIIAQGLNEIKLTISDTQVLRNALDFVHLEDSGGAWYRLDQYNEKDVLIDMWLCPVVLFLWPEFPKVIFFERCFN